jgi:hypothetical protein
MQRGPIIAGILLISLSMGGAWYFLRPETQSPTVDVTVPAPEPVPVSATVPGAGVDFPIPEKEKVIIQEIIRQGVPLVLPVPKKLDFCGERVPLEDPDVRERLERELYIMANRYQHVVFYLKRGHRVLDIIDEEINRKGLPKDLRYIAVAESDLMLAIKSPKGARGVWQFMPATAKRYNLRVDDRIDERMHVAKSTRAALDYLLENKQELGSWTMAAAAYNMGEGRAKRTQQEQKLKNFYKLYMNEETSRYIFRILAAKLLLTDPKKYGYDIPDEEIYPKESLRVIRVSGGISDLVAWSHQHSVTYYDIKRLNPWIIGDKLPTGTFEIAIPELSTRFASATE